jgi:hypothetical protein
LRNTQRTHVASASAGYTHMQVQCACTSLPSIVL